MLQILFSVFFLSGVGRYKKKEIKAAASSPLLTEMLFSTGLSESPPKALLFSTGSILCAQGLAERSLALGNAARREQPPTERVRGTVTVHVTSPTCVSVAV